MGQFSGFTTVCRDALLHLVTAKHVAEFFDPGSCIIAMNGKDGKPLFAKIDLHQKTLLEIGTGACMANHIRSRCDPLDRQDFVIEFHRVDSSRERWLCVLFPDTGFEYDT